LIYRYFVKLASEKLAKEKLAEEKMAKGGR